MTIESKLSPTQLESFLKVQLEIAMSSMWKVKDMFLIFIEADVETILNWRESSE